MMLYGFGFIKKWKGTPLPGPIIKVKAKVLHKKLRGADDDFTSEGWLQCWKNCHDIHQVIISGEKFSADEAAASEFVKKFGQ